MAKNFTNDQPKPVPFAIVSVVLAAAILGGFEASRAALADRFDSGAAVQSQPMTQGSQPMDSTGGTDKGTSASGETSGTNTGGQ